MTEVDHGYSKYPTKVIMDERSLNQDGRLETVTQQLHAVCEVHAATSNALSSAEEHNVRLRLDLEDTTRQMELLRDQNAKLCSDNQHQKNQQDALKDQCITVQGKLTSMAEYQAERGDLLRQSRDQSATIRSLQREANELRGNDEALRAEIEARSVEADTFRRQAEAQLRFNEVVTEECARLKKAMKSSASRRGHKEADIAALHEEVRDLKQKLDRTEKDLSRSDAMVHEVEEEGRRLKRDRVAALRSLQDEQDKAKERELWLRTLRRENNELREQIAQGGGGGGGGGRREEGVKEMEPAGAPIPVLEIGTPVGAEPQTEGILENLKMQNKLQMKTLTNTLQQLMYTVDKKERGIAAL